jgi:hypothetical protein
MHIHARACPMSWMYWGIVGGIISVVAVLLFSILTIYAGAKGSSGTNKRLSIPTKPESLVERPAA